MPEFSLIEAKPYHCGRMARLLRSQHRELVAGLGFDVHRELKNAFDRATIKKAWLVDGRLIALGGMETTLMSSDATVWLALSEEAKKYPLSLMRMLKREIEIASGMKRALSTVLIRADAPSLRFAEFLGFEIEAGPALGCTTGLLRLPNRYREAA